MKLPEWLERASPLQLAVFLTKTASRRKSGLFIRHLCRSFPKVFDARCRAAFDAADQWEAGELDDAAYSAALHPLSDTTLGFPDRVAHTIAVRGYYPSVLSDIRNAILDHAMRGRCPRKNPTARAMRPLVLEYFGNPFQPVELDPSWRTSTVVALAEIIYAQRAFDCLPVLADALQEAGCENADLLDHCRGPGPHVRGCWVVDLVLGKT